MPNHVSNLPFPIDELVDVRLAGIFYELQHLANTINHHFKRGILFPGEDFRASLSSIQSRLLRLRYPIDDNEVLSEGLRLGILAFLSHLTLQLPVQRRLPHPSLCEQIRRAYCRVLTEDRLRVGRDMEDLLFWLLIVGTMSVLDQEEEWLRTIWSNAMVNRPCDWKQARQRLGRVIWVSCIHDEPGEKIFATMIRRN